MYIPVHTCTDISIPLVEHGISGQFRHYRGGDTHTHTHTHTLMLCYSN